MKEKEENIKLSIIVPAYKVEAYIEKCIRSLEDQDLPKDEYEIIVINDGSPDHCREIVEELQKEFSNIVLINQDNQGVSMARNNGISISHGEYIMPIDPDDYILPNQLSSIIKRAESDGLDVLYLSFKILSEDGKPVWMVDYQLQEKLIMNGVDCCYARGKRDRDPDRSWGILFRKAILDKYNIKYPKDVPYLEDGLFLVKVFSVVDKVGFLNSDFYQRTTRLGSATNSNLFYSDKAIDGFIIAAKDLRKFASLHSFNMEQIGVINQGIIKFVILPLTAALGSKNLSSYFLIVKRLRNEGFEKLSLPKMKNIYYHYGKAYNRSKFNVIFYFIKINSSLK